MKKMYIVRLSDEEREICTEVVKKLKGTSQKVRRAQMLLKADANGPGWRDAKIAEAFGCRTQTIENLRKRLVTEGFETKEAIRQTSLPLLSKVIPEQIAINLKEAIEPKTEIQESHGVAEKDTAQVTYACQDHIGKFLPGDIIGHDRIIIGLTCKGDLVFCG